MIRNERHALIVVGTSYKLAPAGCFGIVPKVQISTTAAEAERVRKDSLYQNYVPANEEYKAAIRYILGQAEGRAIQVVVEKRGKVEELRTLKNQ